MINFDEWFSVQSRIFRMLNKAASKKAFEAGQATMRHDPSCFGCVDCMKDAVILDQSKKISAQGVEIRQLQQKVILLKAAGVVRRAPPKPAQTDGRECVYCRGSGEIEVPDGSGFRTTIECGDCNGKGR